MKSSWKGFKVRFKVRYEQAEEISEDRTMIIVWGTERKKIEEKQTEPKRPVGHYQMDQHTHYRSKREKEQRKYLKKKRLKISQIWWI